MIMGIEVSPSSGEIPGSFVPGWGFEIQYPVVGPLLKYATGTFVSARAVPEPGMGALAALGLAGLWRRRMRATRG
jgi:MYXO-CTERM domain-containing protein